MSTHKTDLLQNSMNFQGLDTALYKNLPLLFTAIQILIQLTAQQDGWMH